MTREIEEPGEHRSLLDVSEDDAREMIAVGQAIIDSMRTSSVHAGSGEIIHLPVDAEAQEREMALIMTGYALRSWGALALERHQKLESQE